MTLHTTGVPPRSIHYKAPSSRSPYFFKPAPALPFAPSPLHPHHADLLPLSQPGFRLSAPSRPLPLPAAGPSDRVLLLARITRIGTSRPQLLPSSDPRLHPNRGIHLRFAAAQHALPRHALRRRSRTPPWRLRRQCHLHPRLHPSEPATQRRIPPALSILSFAPLLALPVALALPLAVRAASAGADPRCWPSSPTRLSRLRFDTRTILLTHHSAEREPVASRAAAPLIQHVARAHRGPHSPHVWLRRTFQRPLPFAQRRVPRHAHRSYRRLARPPYLSRLICFMPRREPRLAREVSAPRRT